MPRIYVVARKNGVGIDRDVHLIQKTLQGLGDIEWKSFRESDSLVPQLRHRWRGSLDQPASLALIAERIPRQIRGLSAVTALIPNQERFPRRHLGRLRNIDHVLCKTRHAEQVFRGHCKSVQYIGFTSEDRLLPEITPEFDRFFHLAGKSTLKGTQTLLELWRQHPEWPPLTVVQAADNAPPTVPANVRLITEYLPDAELQRMQNQHGIHLCPSLSEGWGHYIAEAMSCRAVVVTTDGPPMNELVTSERGVVVPWRQSAPRHLGTNWHVDPQALEAVIENLITAAPRSLAQRGANARGWFEDNDAAFARRFRERVGELIASANPIAVSH